MHMCLIFTFNVSINFEHIVNAIWLAVMCTILKYTIYNIIFVFNNIALRI